MILGCQFVAPNSLPAISFLFFLNSRPLKSSWSSAADVESALTTRCGWPLGSLSLEHVRIRAQWVMRNSGGGVDDRLDSAFRPLSNCHAPREQCRRVLTSSSAPGARDRECGRAKVRPPTRYRNPAAPCPPPLPMTPVAQTMAAADPGRTLAD